jgi:hypothetical protein
VNSQPAGSRVLFARGGAWTNLRVDLYNPNVTAAQPMVFDAYGSGAAPVLGVGPGAVGFGFSLGHGQTLPSGGYVLRNLVLDGGLVAQNGIAAAKMANHITIDHVTVRRFQVGVMLHDFTVANLALRNSVVEGNVVIGMLGAGNDWTVEHNTFENNGDARPPSTHAFYFSASGNNRNLVLRNNTFRHNSQPSGVCASGNVTVHGTITGALIEGNTIVSNGYVPGCRGISITAGYPGQEYMRGFTVRGNTVRDSGACVAFNAAPGIVVESNLCVDNTANAFALIENPGNSSGGGDDADSGAVIRNNTVCSTTASAASLIDTVRNATSIIGNITRTGAEASTGPCAP